MMLKDMPKTVMLLLFPLITLSLFIVAAVLWWLIQNIVQGNFG